MDFTVRDLLMAIGMLASGFGTYLMLDRRVTRLEAIEHRVQTIEAAIKDIEEEVSTTGRAMATMAAELKAQGERITKLEGTVQDGIAEVLRAIQARPNA